MLQVWGNLYAALHDESVFPDPHRFNPDRFFNEDGDLEKPVQWIPFSMGTYNRPDNKVSFEAGPRTSSKHLAAWGSEGRNSLGPPEP